MHLAIKWQAQILGDTGMQLFTAARSVALGSPRVGVSQESVTSPDQRAHCMWTQALLMADTRTKSSGPSPRLVTPSGVRVTWRCASRNSPASACCSWWHSTHLQCTTPAHELTGTAPSACTRDNLTTQGIHCLRF